MRGHRSAARTSGAPRSASTRCSNQALSLSPDVRTAIRGRPGSPAAPQPPTRPAQRDGVDGSAGRHIEPRGSAARRLSGWQPYPSPDGTRRLSSSPPTSRPQLRRRRCPRPSPAAVRARPARPRPGRVRAVRDGHPAARGADHCGARSACTDVVRPHGRPRRGRRLSCPVALLDTAASAPTRPPDDAWDRVERQGRPADGRRPSAHGDPRSRARHHRVSGRHSAPTARAGSAPAERA